MEDVVVRVTNEILSESKAFCSCEKCRLDVVTLVLNRMPAHYVATHKGRAFTEIEELCTEFRSDVVREIKKALSHIAKNPRH
jgi:competence protein ComFB